MKRSALASAVTVPDLARRDPKQGSSELASGSGFDFEELSSLSYASTPSSMSSGSMQNILSPRETQRRWLKKRVEDDSNAYDLLDDLSLACRNIAAEQRQEDWLSLNTRVTAPPLQAQSGEPCAPLVRRGRVCVCRSTPTALGAFSGQPSNHICTFVRAQSL